MATRATFTCGTFQKLQGDPSTILKTITFHTSYKEVSNRSFVLKKMLTSPKMFGLKHMNFEFPPTLDQKMHLLTLEAKDFLWGPEKKRREERFLLMKSARKADDLWCIFLDWDSKFGKLLQNAPCFLVFCIMPWIGSCCYWTKVCLRSQYVPRLSGPYENIKALIHAS